MNSNVDKELTKIRELVETNNRILKNLQTRARLHTVFQAIKWVVIILAALGIYTFIQPFLQSLIDVYQSIQESAATITEIKNNLPTGIDFGSIFSGLK